MAKEPVGARTVVEFEERMACVVERRGKLERGAVRANAFEQGCDGCIGHVVGAAEERDETRGAGPVSARRSRVRQKQRRAIEQQRGAVVVTLARPSGRDHAKNSVGLVDVREVRFDGLDANEALERRVKVSTPKLRLGFRDVQAKPRRIVGPEDLARP